jgi:hypothetical protein
MEHLIDPQTEHFSDAERGFQRWRVLARFDSVNRLSRDADPLTQLLLGHLAIFETQPPDRVRY